MNRSVIAIPILALILLGAHALRQNDLGLTAAFCLLAFLFWTRQAWVRLVAVAALLWGGCLWAEATVGLIGFRQGMDLPWTRLAAIMTGVIVFNGLALWVLVGNAARKFFSRDVERGTVRAVMFVLTCFGLALARSQTPFPILLADRYLPGWGWLEIVCLGLYAQWIGAKLLDATAHRRLRPRIWATFSAVFFGQLLLGLAGMERMLMTGALHLPVPALIVGGPLFRGDGFFMVTLFVVTVLLVGSAWCSHLCYIGAWDDVMSRRGPRPAPQPLVSRLAVMGRGSALLLAALAALAFRSMGVSGLTAAAYAAAFGLVGVGVMVFVSSRRGVMTHCSTYCPMGLVANALGKLSPWRIRMDEGCVKCGSCIDACRYNALDERRIELGRPGLSCTLCGDCVSACSVGHMAYRFPGLSPQMARSAFIVLIVSLHAVFLGVARI